jgi:hypothetical protein
LGNTPLAPTIIVATTRKKDNMLKIQKTSRRGCYYKPAYASWLPFAYTSPRAHPKGGWSHAVKVIVASKDDPTSMAFNAFTYTCLSQ